LWFGLSAILIHYRNWWPKPGDNFWAYFYILFALMPFGAAIIGFIDWYVPNKSLFLRRIYAVSHAGKTGSALKKQ
jgi:hypothetical protein